MRIMWLSDNPNSHSGYGTQTRNLVTRLAKKGHFIICVGCNYPPQKYPSYLDNDGNILVVPTDGYSDRRTLEEFFWQYKPDVFVAFTDPRFIPHVFSLEFVIRRTTPLLFWHLWDNEPFPSFNIPYYKSCDLVIASSKFTYDLLNPVLKDMAFIPLGVDTKVFYKKNEKDKNIVKEEFVKRWGERKRFVVGWVSRNTWRKIPTHPLRIFKEFSEGKDDVVLVIHTDPNDRQGVALIPTKNIVFKDSDKFVFLSVPRGQGEDYMNDLYNTFDVHLNTSFAEGFGLCVLESMATGVPNIVTRTGGVQNLVKKEEEVYGWAIEPTVRVLNGSQEVPFIYEDYTNPRDFVEILNHIYDHKEVLDEMGKKCIMRIRRDFSVDMIAEMWDKLLTKVKKDYKKPSDFRIAEL